MARILMVHIRYPEFDRCSGDLRLTNFLRILAESNEVDLLLLYQQPGYATAPENTHYRKLMESLGIKVLSGGLRAHLRKQPYDAIMIEFWYVAKNLIRDIRLFQPQSRLIVDTEHIYFYSNYWKAITLGEDPNTAEALAQKRDELAVYRRADLVLAVTGEDRRVLLSEDSSLEVGVVPNIHDVPDLPPDADTARIPDRLIFVGNFKNNPSNTDAMVWFCREVLPLVQKEVPGAHLQIVGNKPPVEVEALACASVEVTGFVPETAPYLLAGSVSICPLRYGAGLKGKIGEAMMYGLPVVTTTIGTQGMDARQGENMMIGDTPAEFAAGVIALLKDAELRTRVAANGRRFIIDNYSYSAVRRTVNDLFSRLDAIPVRGYDGIARRVHLWADRFAQSLRWRLGK